MATKSLMQMAAEQIARDNNVDPMLTPFDESKNVSNRASGIIANDSPLMQQAATRGTQLAAQRGLTNSSLAAEASQNAVLSAATPLAQGDANLYQQAQLANQAAANQAKTTNAQIGATLGGQGMSIGENARQADVGATVQREQLKQAQGQFDVSQAANQSNFASELGQRKEQFDAAQRQQTTMQGLEAQSRLDVAKVEADFKNNIQGNVNISQAWGTTMTAIGEIQNNPNLEQAAKATLIKNTLDSFASFSTFWSKQTPVLKDVSDLLNFTAATPVTAPTVAGPGMGGSFTTTPTGGTWSSDDGVGRGG